MKVQPLCVKQALIMTLSPPSSTHIAVGSTIPVPSILHLGHAFSLSLGSAFKNSTLLTLLLSMRNFVCSDSRSILMSSGK